VSAFPVILSAPSGGGKTAIAQALLARRADLGYSVSCTTRPPRRGELDGRDYHFLTVEEFERRAAKGEFAEWAVVHGRLYGTLRSEVERVLAQGRHVVMDIDVQGAAQFRCAFPQSVLVFVLPPSGEVLLERLRRRQTEDRQTLASRLRSAVAELREVQNYDYVVENDLLAEAVAAVSSIIDSETHRRDRREELDQHVRAIRDRLAREMETHTNEE